MKKVVIIGGGIGGLFTGAILSHEGLDVTVLEKNYAIGGGLQSFRRFGVIFDAGMHIIGGMNEASCKSEGGSVRRICKYLGMLDRVRIRPVDDDCMDEIYFAEDDQTYRIVKSREGFINSLATYFPEERDNIRRYVDAMYELTEEVGLFRLRPSSINMFMHTPDFTMPVGAFINKYVRNPKLRSLLAYMNPLYGGIESSTPAYIHSILNVLYINGGNRFVNGSYHFAETLREVIEENGGKVIANDGVAHIFTEERNIRGLQTVSGMEYKADYYISAIHPHALMALLDNPKVLPKAYRMRLDSIPNSYSAFSIYIKLKPGRIKYFNYIRYYLSRYDDMWKFGESSLIPHPSSMNNSSPWPRGFMYMTPPEDPQSEYATKMIVTLPMSWDMVKQWENTSFGHRDSEYVEWKNLCAKQILNKIAERNPDFLDAIEDINTASPLTIRDYFGSKDGTMYGFRKDSANIMFSQIPVVTKIPNLLLTGQNINLHGLCGVTLTAVNTCEAILGENYLINKLKEIK